MNNKKLLNLGIFSLFSILSATSASAAVADVLSGPFSQIALLLQKEWFVYTATFIFFFMLFYGIYAVALKNVPVFKGEHGLNHQGKVVALALSGLSLLSLFAFKVNIRQLLDTILSPFGVFSGLMLGALFAAVTYFGIRGAEPDSASLAWAAAAAGIGMMIAGWYLLAKGGATMMAWGMMIAIIAGGIGVASSFSGRGGEQDTTPGNMPSFDEVTGRNAPPVPGAERAPRGPVPNQVPNFRGRRI